MPTATVDPLDINPFDLIADEPPVPAAKVRARFDPSQPRDGEGKWSKSPGRVAAELDELLDRLDDLKGSLPEEERQSLADRLRGWREEQELAAPAGAIESYEMDLGDGKVELSLTGDAYVAMEWDGGDHSLPASRADRLQQAMFRILRDPAPEKGERTATAGGVRITRYSGDEVDLDIPGTDGLSFGDSAEAREFANLLSDLVDTAKAKGLRAGALPRDIKALVKEIADARPDALAAEDGDADG